MNLIRVSMQVLMGLALVMGSTAAFAGAPAGLPDGVGIYVTAGGDYFFKNTLAGGPADSSSEFGAAPGLVGITGDWNGNGVDTPGTYNPANGQFSLSNDGATQAIAFQFGAGGNGAIPLVGNFDTDAADEIAIYIPASGAFWFDLGLDGGAADFGFPFGAGGAGHQPVVGKWNNANLTDGVGIYTTGGVFWIRDDLAAGAADNAGGVGLKFGNGSLTPVAGQWESDTTGVGLYNGASGAFWLDSGLGGGAAEYGFPFGTGAGRTPVVGVWAAP